MNAQTAVRPFNAYAAYTEARDENRNLWDALTRSLSLLEMECDRRERRNEDVTHIRAFIRDTRSQVLG